MRISIGVELALCLLLAGCGGGAASNWAKAGNDAGATAGDYRDCLEMAGTAEKTDIDIDQDIAATRASDIHHARVVRVQAQEARQTDNDRGATIVDKCMQAKGYRPAR
jgi:hypothetical protein